MAIKKIKDIAKQVIPGLQDVSKKGSGWQTYTVLGRKLRHSLGVDEFAYVWLSKVIDYPLHLYLIYVDSKFPTIYFPWTRIKRVQSTVLRKIKSIGTTIKFKKFKMTPPVALGEFSGSLPRNAVFIRIDIAGEYYKEKGYLQPINEEQLRKNFGNKIKIIN